MHAHYCTRQKGSPSLRELFDFFQNIPSKMHNAAVFNTITEQLNMLSLNRNQTSFSPEQCGSSVIQVIDAPPELVWSIIRCFDKPQLYKKFIKNCTMLTGNGEVGSVREVQVISGMPARFSIERLDKLDEEAHVMSFSMIGGDHALKNYHSTISLYDSEDHYDEGYGKTVLVESYVVDVPKGNTKEETCLFVETILRCNLKSLAWVAAKSAAAFSSSEDYSL